jgi:hypothetical protein
VKICSNSADLDSSAIPKRVFRICIVSSVLQPRFVHVVRRFVCRGAATPQFQAIPECHRFECPMKDINEVLRRKEMDLQQLQRDVEALRVAVRLLSEDAEAPAVYTPRAATSVSYAPPNRPAPAAADTAYGASWDAAAKKFP